MAWQPAAVEAEAYEGIRRGDEHAFRLVAEPLQPALEGLARVAVGSEAEVAEVVRHAWASALRGIDLFRWHTPFASWVAHGAVVHARGLARPDVAWTPRAATRVVPGPRDWDDLPWAARWDQALPTLQAAWSALPLPLREVTWALDVERWPLDRARDVLGWPAAVCERRVTEARGRLCNALAILVGDDDARHRNAQVGHLRRTMTLLAPPEDTTAGLPPDVLTTFRRWQASRRPRRLAVLRRRSSGPR